MNTKTRVGIVAVIILIVILVFAFMRTHTASAPTTTQNPAATSTVATLIYESGTKGFSLRYPAGYTIDQKYSYQAQGPGKSIGGVKFTIPSAASANTNLSSDSYMSIEEIPNASSCSASAFVQPSAKVATLAEGDTTYSVASTSDAAAGNRYDETVYAFPGTNPCMAVRYFIHYGVIENYPPDTVHAFDRQALLSQFDAMRRSLIILQ